MLKCGGGKALTKHSSDESALKCPLAIEEPKKNVEGSALIVCDTQASAELEDALKVTPIKTVMKWETGRLGEIMCELYNLEDCVKSEKPVKIDLDLDLYQMEKV